MKSIKKITVFYTDGTFEDIEKSQTIDLSKINPTNPIVNPNWWGGQGVAPATYTWKQGQAVPESITSPKVETFTVSPQPMGSATLSTMGIQALTSAQISSLTGSSVGPWR